MRASETRAARAASPVTSSVNRGGVALMSAAHVVNDFYQGVVPAILPFLAVAYGYSNAAAAGLMFAATAISAIAQPAFGWWADRGGQRWMIWAGMGTAALGIALCGFTESYEGLWIALALSGLGIAAFHPEGARVARRFSGDSTSAMSVFALGGNAGFALGSVVAAAIVVWLGLTSLPLLLVPAAVMAVVLIARLPRHGSASHGGRSSAPGRNDWPSFLRMSTAVVIRSILFFGITSFGALYLIERFEVPTALAAGASSAFLAAGIAGTLIGGMLADRIGRLPGQRIGFALSAAACAGIVLAPSAPIAFAAIVLAGVALYMPFAVMVTLGQDYLPRNMGIASGVTVGLAVSIGGLFSPLLGWLADRTDLQTALAALIPLPLLALLIIWRLRDPRSCGP